MDVADRVFATGKFGVADMTGKEGAFDTGVVGEITNGMDGGIDIAMVGVIPICVFSTWSIEVSRKFFFAVSLFTRLSLKAF